nr:hypothetical protein Iba_chr09aCG14430 [Ipomoea batatas]
MPEEAPVMMTTLPETSSAKTEPKIERKNLYTSNGGHKNSRLKKVKGGATREEVDGDASVLHATRETRGWVACEAAAAQLEVTGLEVRGWRLPAMDGVASRLEVVGRSGSFEISDLRSVRVGHHWTLEFRSQISDFGGAAGDLEPWRSTTVGGWH